MYFCMRAVLPKFAPRVVLCSSHYTDISTHLHAAQQVSELMPHSETSSLCGRKRDSETHIAITAR